MPQKLVQRRPSQARRTDLETSLSQIGDNAVFALIQVKYSEKAKGEAVEFRKFTAPACRDLLFAEGSIFGTRMRGFAPPQIFAARINLRSACLCRRLKS